MKLSDKQDITVKQYVQSFMVREKSKRGKYYLYSSNTKFVYSFPIICLVNSVFLVNLMHIVFKVFS